MAGFWVPGERFSGGRWSGRGKAARLCRMRRLAVIFRGRVQGVGFRYAAQRVAARFAVSGWVRNEPDGTVRLEVQGEPAEVAGMVEALGSQMSGYIHTTRTDPMVVSPGEQGFGIRR